MIVLPDDMAQEAVPTQIAPVHVLPAGMVQEAVPTTSAPVHVLPANMVQVGVHPRSAPVTVPLDATLMPSRLPVLPRTIALRATPAGMV